MQSFLEKVKEDPKLLKSIRQGIEKEGLRCNEQMYASRTEHPKALGSKLTHPYITTDFSENLLEFISPVFDDSVEMFSFLRELFSFTYQSLDEGDVIWPASMPCLLPDKEDDIPVAFYGNSNVGKLKTLYRIGLGNRYGKSMQSIAGVHYNFSLTDDFWIKFKEYENNTDDFQTYKNEKYFHIIRNYRRYSWLLIYLFGSSPVVAENFLNNKEHNLMQMGKKTFGKPYATSLRMGGLGYTSDAQKEISVCYNHLNTYLKSLEEARLTLYPDYEKIGIKDSEGYKQLNANLLQIDNEFYSTIRPKRTAKTRESALQALDRGGIEYLELRLLDVDPFSDTGLSIETVKFLHNFLFACLFMDSPIISKKECDEIDKNFLTIVNEGRDPNALMFVDGKKSFVKDSALNLLDKISKITHQLDIAYGSNIYSKSLDLQKHKVLNPDLTPSAKLLKLVTAEKSITQVVYDLAIKYKAIHVEIALDNELKQKWEKISLNSFKEQKQVEDSDKLDFDDFLNEYFENIKIKNG